MIIRLGLALMVGLCATAASAQSLKTTDSASSATMKELLDQGFEIKAAVPNGSKFVVFMQKDQSAYACEFVSVTQTRCGAIN